MSEPAAGRKPADAIPPRPVAPSHSRTLARLVHGKNINETSLLATDYLNHFNEIIMLIEMIPSMPDCLDDAQAWRPKSYEAHFRDSSFSDRDLAILAYDNAPPRFREPFDSAVAAMDALVARGLKNIEAAIQSANEDLLNDATTAVARTLRELVDVCSAIINGGEVIVDQAKIDEILTG